MNIIQVKVHGGEYDLTCEKDVYIGTNLVDARDSILKNYNSDDFYNGGTHSVEINIWRDGSVIWYANYSYSNKDEAERATSLFMNGKKK